MVNVLIVEDSVTQREIFRRLLADDPELSVVAEARNGKEAIELVHKHEPDVVLMDIHMPDMDGIMATAEIMRSCPVPIVVASATLKKRDVDLAMKAYDAGAVAVIEKPEGAVLLHLKKIAPDLRRELLAASKSKLQRVGKQHGTAVSAGRAPRQEIGDSAVTSRDKKNTNCRLQLKNVSILGICASTGGPPVILKILSGLPKPCPVPVLLVQHISAGFEEGFARWLAASSGHAVEVVTAAQRIAPGIWLAPSGRHLGVSSTTRLDLHGGKPSDIHCPSGNPLFESLGKHFGDKAAGIQLTGMGDDGAAGLLKLKEAGGVTIGQDGTSCLIDGMPNAAQRIGAATYELTPEEIVEVFSSL